MREYSKVSQSLWQSRRFMPLSDDARFAYLYLLTCPHGNSIGCFRLPMGYAETDLKWGKERVEKALSELSDSTLIDLYGAENMVRIDKFLHHNPVTNQKHASGSAKLAFSLPDSPLKYKVFKDLTEQKNKPPDDILQEIHSAMEGLSKGYSTETETETNSEPKGSGADAPVDWKAVLFSESLEFLSNHYDKPKDKYRSLLGKWRMRLGEDCEALVEIIREAEVRRESDPVAWIEAAIQSRRGEREPGWKRENIKATEDFLNA